MSQQTWIRESLETSARRQRQASAAAAQTATSRCRLQAVLDGLMGRRRSPHFADEVCRVVRAAHAGVLRDLWIGTDWPCHVDAVVADS